MQLSHLKGRRPNSSHSRSHSKAAFRARGVRLWSDEDDEIVSAPGWSMILIFAIVPLIALITFLFSVAALISTILGTEPTQWLGAGL